MKKSDCRKDALKERVRKDNALVSMLLQFHVRRAAARALTIANASYVPSRVVANRVTVLRSTTSPSVRPFSFVRPRYAEEKLSEATSIPAAQEEAATSESTDAIPRGSETRSAAQQPAVKEDQPVAATSETTDQIDAAASTTSSQTRPAKQSAAEVGPSRTIYVGNLSWEATLATLEERCVEFGEVSYCRLATTPDGKSKGFGFVEYKTHEQAKSAVEALAGADLYGRPMRVRLADEFARPKSGNQATNNAPGKCVYIGNLSFEMTDRELNDLFRDIKNVLDVRVAIDRRTGQPRGFAHADFTDIESATEAKNALHKKIIHNRQLKVDFAPSKAR